MFSIDFKIYELFKKRFSEEEANLVIEYFESKDEEKIKQKQDIFLTKDDKVDLIKWMVGFWIAQMAATVGLYLRK